MKVVVGLALAWTAVFLVVVLFFGGDVAPCPELRLVGIPEADRAAIARMCEDRYRETQDVIAANEPWSWLVIWAVGLGAIAVAFGGVRRLSAGPGGRTSHGVRS